jgi:hypothetical protein
MVVAFHSFCQKSLKLWIDGAVLGGNLVPAWFLFPRGSGGPASGERVGPTDCLGL